ncbi:MAG: ATP-binding protein [Candidatus Altiarchaeota archaeon]|nr:ATP-binding protein [Candidatus Altiarchaeota archaeon]
MIVSIASGKGGTGKTTLAVNLALALDNVRLIDCDVEEPNCHLFLKPDITGSEPVNIRVPGINEGLCDGCGKCAEFCEYNALAVVKGKVMKFLQICHGCGGCTLVCPKGAITETERTIGEIRHGTANGIDFSYGLLNIGEAMSAPIIQKLKVKEYPSKDTIIDAPPGTSCAVIEAVKGTDYCILVTEPTPFGLNDLKLAIEMLRTMKIPFGVVINRDGMGDSRVEEYCLKEGIEMILKIPYDRRIAELYSRGIPFTREFPEYREKLFLMYEKIGREVGK